MGERETAMAELFDRLWPIMRSITGEGVRSTHDILSEYIPLKRTEVPSGTKVFDWEVPPEWVFRKAYIKGPDGKIIVDANEHNLHVLNYSAPIRAKFTREELEDHLFSLPDRPNAIPYVTSYYEKRWGFCLSHNQREALPDGEYEVCIDSDFIPDGSLTYSEAVIKGRSDREILFSTYTCHPSMANNELSGPLVAAFLYQALAEVPDLRYTYRFLFIPETIGSITYLAEHGERLREKLHAGYVMTCVGNDAPITYKRSRRLNSVADRAASAAWNSREDTLYLDFFPSGSDERQYCSPAFNLPVGVVARTYPGKFDAYHTSDDNKSFISFETMSDTVDAMLDLVQVHEKNFRYKSLNPYCEPNLGSRGLMSTLGAARDSRERYAALKWLLNMADGEHDLIAISERSGLPVNAFYTVADLCEQNKLIERA